MEDLHKIDYATLVDLLSEYTARYTQLISERNMTTKEFYECKIILKLIQKEIEVRENPKEDNSLFLQD